MPDIATVLKEEIRRLARKEARTELAVLRRQSVQYRHDIARLKRELENAQRKLGMLESEVKRKVLTDPPAEAAENRRFSARGLKSHRERLGLSAADLGKLLGVTGQTIYNWEQGKARPRQPQLAKLVEVRALGKRAVMARLDALVD